MTVPLTPEDVAYMRATQTEHQPTLFRVVHANKHPDGVGGMATNLVPGETLPGRLDAQPDRVPDYITELVTRGPAASVSLTKTSDVQTLTSGDLLVESWGDGDTIPENAWEVVSLGESDEWTTALVVWVQRWRRKAGVHGNR